MNVLIVLTSQKTIGTTKKETGFHLSEFTHPYEFFINHGYSVTVASPKGGECPITSPHPEDKINASFLNNPDKMKIIKSTKKLSDLEDKHFDAVYVVGGHGTMFDLSNNKVLADIMVKTYGSGGILGAVCHGPAAFVGVKDKNEKYIIENKRINSFTNIEEEKTPYYKNMPFLLESKLVEQGAKFEKSSPRKSHLTIDSNIVTGQNPESVDHVTGAIYTLLQNKTSRD